MGEARSGHQAEDPAVCLCGTFLFLSAHWGSEMLFQGLKRENLELPHTPERKKEGISEAVVKSVR